MASFKTYYQGQSFNLVLPKIPKEDLTDWVCTLQIRDAHENIYLTKTVTTRTTDNTAYTDLITSTESKKLPVKKLMLGYELYKSSTDERYSAVKYIEIREDLVK